MTVIGIDTASRLGGIGIVSEGRLLGAEVIGVEEGHSQNILPALESLMKTLGLGPNDVKGIAVAVGPGSYTGLRIGVAVAKGLAYAWKVPLRGVSTLFATAWPLAGAGGVICASLDARRDHVYAVMYAGRRLASAGCGDADALVPEDRWPVDEIVSSIRKFLAEGEDVYLVGDGAPVLYARWQEACERMDEGEGVNGRARLVQVPLLGDGLRAAHVAHIGEIELLRGAADDPFELKPNYLRRSEAERRWRQSP